MSLVIVDTVPALCKKGDFSPAKRMIDIFVYVLEFMLNLDKMQNNSKKI